MKETILTLDQLLSDIADSLSEADGQTVANIANSILTSKVHYDDENCYFVVQNPLELYVIEACEAQFGLISQNNGVVRVDSSSIYIESKGSMLVDEVLDMANEIVDPIHEGMVKGYDMPEDKEWRVTVVSRQSARIELHDCSMKK